MVERASDADLAAVGVEAEELVLVARQNAVLDTCKQRDNAEVRARVVVFSLRFRVDRTDSSWP